MAAAIDLGPFCEDGATLSIRLYLEGTNLLLRPGLPLLYIGRFGGVPIEHEGATLGLVATARADTRPDDAPAVRVAEHDAGPDCETGRAGGAYGDAQPHRRGNDPLTAATGRGERERGRAGDADSADVGHTAAAACLGRCAGATSERPAAAVRDAATGRALGGAARGHAGRGAAQHDTH